MAGRIFGVIDGHLNRHGHKWLSDHLGSIVKKRLNQASQNNLSKCFYKELDLATIDEKKFQTLPSVQLWVHVDQKKVKELEKVDGGRKPWFVKHQARIYAYPAPKTYWLRRGTNSQFLSHSDILEISKIRTGEKAILASHFLCDSNTQLIFTGQIQIWR